jgi:hypothetical protein
MRDLELLLELWEGTEIFISTTIPETTIKKLVVLGLSKET